MQDADCRGDVLDIMLAMVRRGRYTPSQLQAMLRAQTESVPLQKFQVHAAAGSVPVQPNCAIASLVS